MLTKTHLLAAVICCCWIQTQAQTPSPLFADQSFRLILKLNGIEIKTYQEGECGFRIPTTWQSSPAIPDICLPVVWGFDTTPDSLGCDSLPHDYSGKLIMLRRGGCEFGTKALRAQAAGAKVMAIANGIAASHGDDCTVINMALGISGSTITIPAIFLSRAMADDIILALSISSNVEICFRQNYLSIPTAGYHYFTPVRHIVPVKYIGCTVTNVREFPQSFKGKVVITDPVGSTTTLFSDSVYLEPTAKTRIKFPAYTPVPDLVGTYSMMFTAVAGGVTQLDTLYNKFEITDYTWGTDNGERVFPTPIEEWWGTPDHTTGSLVVTGNTTAYAGTVIFGIENALQVANQQEPESNIVNVLLYDADKNNDGIINLGNSVLAFDNLELVSYADVAFDQNTTNALQEVTLTPVTGNNTLKANHLYYAVLKYDEPPNTATSIMRFSASQKVHYAEEEFYHTPLVLDGLYRGWENETVMVRLSETDDVGTHNSPQLDASKFSLSPNPTADWAYFDLQLERENPFVRVEVLDRQGRTVLHQNHKQFQAGRIAFDLSQLPAGLYYVHAYTSREGSAMVPVVKR